MGKQIAELVNKDQMAGFYDIEFRGETLPSGVYIFKIIAGDFVDSKKMILTE